MKQCFGYVRVSTKKQGEGVSLEAQKDAILCFAKQNGIRITKWFEEEQTAAKSGRPVFSAMLKALRAHKAEGVVMHKIDRSARNFRDWARIGDLSDAGIDVHFASESLDFRSRGGRLSADIQAVIAADYIRNLKDEIRKGQRRLLDTGYYPFSAPIGYRDNGKGKLKTPDPEQAHLVRLAFELYASERHSIRSLLIEMNQRGLRNKKGGPVSKGCLEGLLSNPFYTGVIHVRRTGDVYQGKHKPIISVSLFETVQETKKRKYHKKVTRHDHLFRGLFRCRQCQTSMIPEGKRGHVYYRCQKQACPTNSIREEQIDRTVSAGLKKTQIGKTDFQAFEAAFTQWWKTRQLHDPKKAIQLQIEHINAKEERLTDAVIDGLIDKAAFSKRREKLLLERSKLEEELRLDASIRLDFDGLKKFLEHVKNLAQHYEIATRDEKREIIEMAFSDKTVWAKNVELKPSNWLQAADSLVGVFSCGDTRPTSRTKSPPDDQYIESLIEQVERKLPNYATWDRPSN
ncbi:MAG: recombinase family protein [Pseudomonadota bacterium]